MSIDLSCEEAIPLGDVPALPWMPRRRRGKRLHKSTPFRWANPGIAGVRLECVRCGNTLVTTAGALNRFFARLAQAKGQARAPQFPTQPRGSGAAGRELDEAGF